MFLSLFSVMLDDVATTGGQASMKRGKKWSFTRGLNNAFKNARQSLISYDALSGTDKGFGRQRVDVAVVLMIPLRQEATATERAGMKLKLKVHPSLV